MNDEAKAPVKKPKPPVDTKAKPNSSATTKATTTKATTGTAKDNKASAAKSGQPDKAAKDQAAKDKAAKDQAAKDQAAKDQAAKDQAAKDKAAKDKAAKDQAAKDKAAQNPPAAKNAPTCDAKSNCPANAPKVCNTSSLTLTVTPYKQNDPTDRPNENKLELTAPRQYRGDKIAKADRKALGEYRCEELKRYDLILETVASTYAKSAVARQQSKIPETRLKIAAKAEWAGTCGDGKHPAIWMEPTQDAWNPRHAMAVVYRGGNPEDMYVDVDPESLDGKKVNLGNKLAFPVGTKGFTLTNVFAPPMPGDKYTGGAAFTAFFKLVDLLLSMFVDTAMEFEIVADSCNAPPVGAKPAKNLNALLRVYRDMTIGITMTIPKGKKKSYEERGDYSSKFSAFRDANHHTAAEVKTGTTTETEYRRLPGTTLPTDVVHTPDVYSLTLKINDFEIPIKEEDKTAQQTHNALKAKLDSEVGVMAAGNAAKGSALWAELQARFSGANATLGTTHTPPTTITGWKAKVWTFGQKAKAYFNELRNIRNLWDQIAAAFRKAPKLGWFIDWELSILAVAITGSVSRKSANDVLPDRLVRLVPNGKLEVALTFLEAKVLMGFGIILDFGESAYVEATITFSLTGTLAVKAEMSLLDDTVFTMVDSIVAAIVLHIEVRIGSHVAFVDGRLEWGFAVNATVTWKTAKGSFEGTVIVSSLPISISLVFDSPVVGAMFPESIQLTDGFELARETFPKVPS